MASGCTRTGCSGAANASDPSVWGVVTVELLADKDEKKDRNVDIRGRLSPPNGAAFFLCESDESEEWDVSLPDRARADALLLDDGPAERSASEMSCRPCPRLDMVRSRSTSARRHCGVFAEESVKSGVPGPRSGSSPIASMRSDESADLASCETGTACEETERPRARLGAPLRADEELASAACASSSVTVSFEGEEG